MSTPYSNQICSKLSIWCGNIAKMLANLIKTFLYLAITIETSQFLFASAMSVPKRILVTGANKGIGKAICQKLLSDFPDAYVLLGSRDASRGSAAVASIVDALGADVSSRIEPLTIDVTDQTSISSAADKIKEKFGAEAPLYGLINNAGVGFGYTLGATMATNYYGPKLVSEAMVPLLQPSDGRIVNIASASGPMYIAKCDSKSSEVSLLIGDSTTIEELEAFVQQKLQSGADDANNENYGFSKACLNAYTKAFAKQHPALIINSCTPGFIATDLTAGLGATNEPEKGTVAPLYCLFTPREAIGSGKYFGSDAVRSPLDRYRGPGDPPYEP